MKECYEHRENHSHCGLSGHATLFPTRLIDVGEVEDDLIRLVETGHDSVTNPYLILSYCWGQGNESARTTRENLESRLCRFSMTTLPKTIRDAILLTKMMGFQYLWVDAMCIVQASDDDPGDFKLEAMRMRDYYANAQCCISASLARDSSEGFLTGRPLGRFPVPRVVALKLASSTSSQSALFKGEQRPAFRRADVLEATPLMERGWYVQELMLSRRILHWTLHGVHLECQSSLFIEGRAQRVRRGTGEATAPREVLAVPDDDVLTYAGWYQLINTYSWKQLSYESDRMYAIHGIASLLVQRCGAEYLCGVFRSSIAQGLAWSHDCEGGGDPETLDRRPPKHVYTQLPTWSWASNCAVRFHPIEEAGFVRDDHPQRPPLFPVHPKNMSLAEGIDTRLYIRAPLIVVFLQRVDKQITASTEDSWGRCVNGQGAGGFLDAQRSNQDDALYDSFLAGLDEGISILWLVLGLATDENDWYVGLLLQRKGETFYQRYGLLQILWEPDDIEDRFNIVEEIILE
ncbi:heterokaryon incompatibility protein [Colletotrichum kahawae]|uniref:Heterokaryon incompatibility protein n=1 Tax=Colletotrichum kahawae TaxID=34407 RepID=A0AAE0DCJ2_COLKA|nr:heterokaryon incompatibility protein [Colletotrichum kahawae]